MGKHVMVIGNAAMARRQLSTDRGRAIAWLQDGATQQNVAQSLHVSQRFNGRVCIRFLDTGNVTNRPRSGRPRSTNREKTGTSPTGHFVNVESLPDSSTTTYGQPQAP